MKLTLLDVSKVLGIEFLFYPHIPITKDQAMAWFMHFNECEREEFVQAMHKAVADSKDKFPPVPASVWEEIKKIRKEKEKSGLSKYETRYESIDGVEKVVRLKICG